jgi:hypothetical protein
MIVVDTSPDKFETTVAGHAMMCHPDQQHELLPEIVVLSWDVLDCRASIV